MVSLRGVIKLKPCLDWSLFQSHYPPRIPTPFPWKSRQGLGERPGRTSDPTQNFEKYPADNWLELQWAAKLLRRFDEKRAILMKNNSLTNKTTINFPLQPLPGRFDVVDQSLGQHWDGAGAEAFYIYALRLKMCLREKVSLSHTFKANCTTMRTCFRLLQNWCGERECYATWPWWPLSSSCAPRGLSFLEQRLVHRVNLHWATRTLPYQRVQNPFTLDVRGHR